MGFYEVLLHSRCITYSMSQSARFEFGETETAGMDAKCTAVIGVSGKTHFQLKDVHLKENQYPFERTLYLEYSHRFTSSSDSPFL